MAFKLKNINNTSFTHNQEDKEVKKITMSLIILMSLTSWGQTIEKAVELPTGELTKTLAHLSGLSLYVFDPDQNSGGKSVCTGTCAEKWPPYILTEGEGQ